MKKTTVNLPDDLHLRVRQMAEREGITFGEAVTRLLRAGLAGAHDQDFASHAVGEADVDDLGVNAEKYLREGLR